MAAASVFQETFLLDRISSHACSYYELRDILSYLRPVMFFLHVYLWVSYNVLIVGFDLNGSTGSSWIALARMLANVNPPLSALLYSPCIHDHYHVLNS